MSVTAAVPDARERDEALDTTRSFVVQAPAGSGKTGLLIQRTLALLQVVEAPEQILAITFTRKAAAEMRERLLAALGAAASEATAGSEHDEKILELARAALAADRVRGWALLENPGRLRIQTIDSFCTELARQLPLLSGFGAQPDVTEDADELYTEAARRTLLLVHGETERGRAVFTLLAHLGYQARKFVELVTAFLRRRDQWLRLLERAKSSADRETELERVLGVVVRKELALVPPRFPKALAERLPSLARFAAENLRKAASASSIPLLADLTGLPAADPSELPRWQALAKLLLTDDGAWRKPKGVNKSIGFPASAEHRAMKEAFAELLDALHGNDDLRRALHQTRILPEPRYTAAQRQAIDALLAVLPAAAGELRLVFRERQKVDFAEIAWGAREALGSADDPGDLLLKLDRRIAHVLVDEFQDTSQMQIDLIERLTAGWMPDDGRTIFLVGDPMQSIYRFRDADVGLFLRLQEEGLRGGEISLQPLRLKTNFRSTTAVVEWVNRTFETLFPREDDVSAGAVSYNSCEAVRTAPPETGVHLHFSDDANPRREASEILEIVRATREHHPEKTIGILARSRSALTEVVVALSSAAKEDPKRYRYQAQELFHLSSQPVIQDLFALTRALLQPADRIAWLTILRAPWCGLTRADLFRLCADDAEAPVWDLLRNDRRLETLSHEGRERALRLREVTERAREERFRRRLRDLVEGTWIDLGGPACVDGQGMADAADFFELVGKLEKGGTITPPEAIETRLEKLFARPDPEAGESIQVLTMHGAKGLEFDVVILPGLGRTPRREESRLVYAIERSEGLLLAPLTPLDGKSKDPIYDFIDHLDSASRDHETLRLIYVAATRAREELHLFGHVKPTSSQERKPKVNSLLQALWKSVEGDALSWLETNDRSAGETGLSGTGTASRASPRRLPATWTRPEPAPPIATPTAGAQWSTDEGELPLPSFPAGEVARHVGTVVHDVLCRIARAGLECWNAERIENARPRIRVALATEGVCPADLDTASDRVTSALTAALADERGRWILSNHPEAQSELPLTGVVGGEIVRGILDRTFVADPGVRWVIDFKTGQHEGGEVERFLDEQRELYRAQLERYARLIRLGDPRPIRLGLYFPLLRGWREWS